MHRRRKPLNRSFSVPIMGPAQNCDGTTRHRSFSKELKKSSALTLGRLVPVAALTVLFFVALTMLITGKGHKLICSFTHATKTVICKNKLLQKIPDDIPKSTLALFVGDKTDKHENRFTTITRSNFSKIDNLQELVLIKCGIEDIQPMAFADLKNLHKLDLRYNHIQLITEDTFKGLTKLTVLELSNNPIKSIGTFSFRGMDIENLLFGNNPTLESIAEKALVGAKIDRLVFDRCKLNRLHLNVFTGAAELKEISITNNKQVLDFPPKLFSGIQLEKLDLSNNGLSESDFLEFTETRQLVLDGNVFPDLQSSSFNGLSILKQLSLANLQLTHIPKHIFSPLVNLERLNLEGNSLSEIASETFVNMKNLKHLKLSNNKISQIKGSIFKLFRTLQSLYLDGNAFQSLPEKMASPFSHLKILIVHNNPFHCNCELKWFAAWIENHPRLVQYPQLIRCETPAPRAIKYMTSREFRCSPPTILNATLEPEAMSLICTAEGDPAPRILWETTSGETQMEQPPLNKNVFKSVSALIITKGGEYTCIARNIAGEARVVVNTKKIPKSGLRFAQDSERIKILETPGGLLFTAILLGILGYAFKEL